MTERLVKIWTCDECGVSARRNVMPPAGWHEAHAGYGNYLHCCPRDQCQKLFVLMCLRDSITVPDTIGGDKYPATAEKPQ